MMMPAKLNNLIMSFFSRKIIKNFSYLTFGAIVSQIISLLVSAVIARELKPDGYGSYNVLLTHVGIFGTISAFGYRMVIINIISKKEYLSNQITVAALILRFLSINVSFILFYFYIVFIYQFYNNNILIIAWFYLLFIGISDVLESVAFGEKKMLLGSVLIVVQVLIQLSCILLIQKDLLTIENLFCILTFSILIKCIVYIIYAYKWNYLRKVIIPDLSKYWELFRVLFTRSYPFFILAIFTVLSNQVPVLILDSLTNAREVGIFNAGYKLSQPIKLLLSTAISAVFPNLAFLYSTNTKRFNKIIKNGFNILFFVGFALAFSFSIFQKELVKLIFGELYIRSSVVFSLQVWFLLLYAIFSLIGLTLSVSDQQKKLSYLSIFYSLIAIPIYFLSSNQGAVGLSVGFLIAGLINMIYHIPVFNRFTDNSISMKKSVGYLLLFGTGFAFSHILGMNAGIYIRLAFCLSGVFLIVLHLYRKIQKYYEEYN